MTSKSIPRGASVRPFSMTILFYATVCFGTTLPWFGSEKSGAGLFSEVQSFIFQVPKALKRRLKSTLFVIRFFEHLVQEICGKSEKMGSHRNDYETGGAVPFLFFFSLVSLGEAFCDRVSKSLPIGCQNDQKVTQSDPQW